MKAPPLVSFGDEIAAEASASRSATRSRVNVLGRDVTAEIASLRTINWQSLVDQLR